MFVPRLSFENPLEIHPQAHEGGGCIVPPFHRPKNQTSAYDNIRKVTKK